jgi:hypothetical protein
MAVRVGVSGVTTKSVAVSGSTTQVKKIVVGRPVRRVANTSTVSGLGDVDVSQLQNGSVLVYNTDSSKWVATKDLAEGTTLNGGSF